MDAQTERLVRKALKAAHLKGQRCAVRKAFDESKVDRDKGGRFAEHESHVERAISSSEHHPVKLAYAAHAGPVYLSAAQARTRADFAEELKHLAKVSHQGTMREARTHVKRAADRFQGQHGADLKQAYGITPRAVRVAVADLRRATIAALDTHADRSDRASDIARDVTGGVTGKQELLASAREQLLHHDVMHDVDLDYQVSDLRDTLNDHDPRVDVFGDWYAEEDTPASRAALVEKLSRMGLQAGPGVEGESDLAFEERVRQPLDDLHQQAADEILRRWQADVGLTESDPGMVAKSAAPTHPLDPIGDAVLAALGVSPAVRKSFDESKHHRDHGKFSDGDGSGGTVPHSHPRAKTAARALLAKVPAIASQVHAAMLAADISPADLLGGQEDWARIYATHHADVVAHTLGVDALTAGQILSHLLSHALTHVMRHLGWTALRKSKDAAGHEHKGKGKDGGQFTAQPGSGDGGASRNDDSGGTPDTLPDGTALRQKETRLIHSVGLKIERALGDVPSHFSWEQGKLRQTEFWRWSHDDGSSGGWISERDGGYRKAVAGADREVKDRDSREKARRKKQIRSTEFKSWFGDWESDPAKASKVTDRETGDPAETHPIRVYHGSRVKFDQFDRAKLGSGTSLDPSSLLGFNFTEDDKIAKGFVRAGGALLTCYLSIKTPWETTEDEIWERCLAKSHPELLGKWREKKNAGIGYYDRYNAAFDELSNGEIKAMTQGLLDDLRSEGYDGIRYLNQVETGAEDRYDWIVFDPTQVKSVDNDGAFDPSNPSIYKSVAAVTKSFQEEDHPRGHDGRWIEQGHIDEAKSDPAKAAELRERVSPEDAHKLEAKLGDKPSGDRPRVAPDMTPDEVAGHVDAVTSDPAQYTPDELYQLSKLASAEGGAKRRMLHELASHEDTVAEKLRRGETVHADVLSHYPHLAPQESPGDDAEGSGNKQAEVRTQTGGGPDIARVEKTPGHWAGRYKVGDKYFTSRKEAAAHAKHLNTPPTPPSEPSEVEPSEHERLIARRIEQFRDFETDLVRELRAAGYKDAARGVARRGVLGTDISPEAANTVRLVLGRHPGMSEMGFGVRGPEQTSESADAGRAEIPNAEPSAPTPEPSPTPAPKPTPAKPKRQKVGFSREQLDDIKPGMMVIPIAQARKGLVGKNTQMEVLDRKHGTVTVRWPAGHTSDIHYTKIAPVEQLKPALEAGAYGSKMSEVETLTAPTTPAKVDAAEVGRRAAATVDDAVASVGRGRADTSTTQAAYEELLSLKTEELRQALQALGAHVPSASRQKLERSAYEWTVARLGQRIRAEQ